MVSSQKPTTSIITFSMKLPCLKVNINRFPSELLVAQSVKNIGVILKGNLVSLPE